VIDMNHLGLHAPGAAWAARTRAARWCGCTEYFVAGDDERLDAAAAWSVAEAAVKADRPHAAAPPVAPVGGGPGSPGGRWLEAAALRAAIGQGHDHVVALVLTGALTGVEGGR